MQQHRDVVERLAESHHVEHHGGAVVGGVVDDLHAADLLDALTRAGQRQRKQVVGEAGIDAVDEQARIAFPRSIFDRGEQLVWEDLPRVLQEHRAAADDVDAGGQDAPIVLERVGQPVVGHRGVDRALRAGGQHLVEVGGGGDAGRDIKAGKLSGVFAGLGVRRHPDAGELVVRDW